MVTTTSEASVDPTYPSSALVQERSLPERKRRRGRIKRLSIYQVISIASIFAGIGIWQLVNVLVNQPLFMAGPYQVVIEARRLIASGALGSDVWATGQEFFIGMGLSIALGVTFGVLCGTSRIIRSIFAPWINAANSTPIIALAPIFILWFGISIDSKLPVIILLCVPTILINTQAGIEATGRNYLEVGRVLLLSRMEMIRKIYLPSALPIVVTGIRLAIGRALIGAVVAEFFGSRAGLGFGITIYTTAYNMAAVFTCVVVLAFAAMVLSSLMKRFEEWLTPWQYA